MKNPPEKLLALLPCPLCGMEPKFKGVNPAHYIQCSCGISLALRHKPYGAHCKQRIIDLWNTRFPLSKQCAWPEKKEVTEQEIGEYSIGYKQYCEKNGWNACRDAFMEIINGKKECKHELKDASLIAGRHVCKCGAIDPEAQPSQCEQVTYPCDDCGNLRTKAEGGTTFTVCDECWDKHYRKDSPK